MENKKKQRDIISRRQFFKKAAGYALPILAMGLAPSLLSSCEIDEEMPDLDGIGGGCSHCGGKCTASCANNCTGKCRVSCQSACRLTCSEGCSNAACKSVCKGTCKGACFNSCKGSCSSSATGGTF